MHGKADYSLTGDARHFDHLYGKRIAVFWWCGRRGILDAGAGGLKPAVSPHSFSLLL
jgi:hypothetical protein